MMGKIFRSFLPQDFKFKAAVPCLQRPAETSKAPRTKSAVKRMRESAHGCLLVPLS